ncbi:polyamine oxidase 2-like [Gigantopelta aegis]|uniref:polyamine oxidase 2-like n=1 Tax=Gigantopelta aegis TaxID=1735272 RepID=UPI001B8892F1|nr:polyamine oxidase 2-like [Gigantopelta aegis]
MKYYLGDVQVCQCLVLFMFVSHLSLTDGRHKRVIVVGGGIAGLAAARKISNCKTCDIHVTVFEARRDRYGGRIWTDKKHMPHARGIEAELGGSTINMQVKNNPLSNLTRDFELETSKFGESIFVMPDGKTYRGKDLADVYVKAIDIVASAVHRVRSNQKDVSMREAITRWVEEEEGELDMDGPVGLFLRTLPSFSVGSYSALLYRPSDLDFGYEQVVLDGMSEVLDRLVSGSGPESPLEIELRMTVRQIELKPASRIVLVRTKDREQFEADAVIVAVPLSVIRKEKLVFEPALSKDYRYALDQVGISSGNKLIVEFDEVFWPEDVGVFVLAPATEADEGFLQVWLNSHKLGGTKSLTGMMFGPAADRFENMTDEEVETKARQQLSKLFGVKKVEARNVTQILRSDWSKNIYTGGASSFPQVGNNPTIWDTLSKPICPLVFFAGEHTILEGIGTMHGAYQSGLRAAEQFLSGYCDKHSKHKDKHKQKPAPSDGDKQTLNKNKANERDKKKDEL